MNNVIALRPRVPDISSRLVALSTVFADRRRARGDVFWLKENAEWLGLIRGFQAPPDPAVIAPYEAYFQNIPEQLRFFPQYYRFFLSLYLDLEDLGLAGDGDALCAWVAERHLAGAELSDLQRGETERLLARRGHGCADPELESRLHAFTNRSETFALPNMKAAYELTHIIFYLSDYGRVDPRLGDAAKVSLDYAGIVAYLDQNADLLAEICIAQRFARMAPPPLWEAFVCATHTRCQLSDRPDMAGADGYHCFLVTGQLMEMARTGAFQHAVPPVGQVAVSRPATGPGALRDLSEGLYGMGLRRGTGWDRMRGAVMQGLSDMARGVVEGAEKSTPQFGSFFESFARSESPIGLM